MKPVQALVVAALASCSEEATTVAPYLISATAVDPIDPFVVTVAWEPSAGDVSAYAVEARAPGGAFVALARVPGGHLLAGDQAWVDLTSVVPDGGPVELRVRAYPGGSASNTVNYDPGPALSTVTVGQSPDPSTHAFVVRFSNRTAPQVLLQRRVVQADGAAGLYVQIAAGSGGSNENIYLDADLAAWTDGALYEYQAVSSVPGSLLSRTADTTTAPLLAPEIVSYLPGPTAATVVVRNNSAYATSLSLTSGRRPGDILLSLGAAAPPQAGTIAFVDDAVNGFDGKHYAYYEITAYGGNASTWARSNVVSTWEVEQPLDAPLQAVTRTLQSGTSAAQDARGNFCIMEPIDTVQQYGGARAVFPPGGDASLALVVPTNPPLRCRIDAVGHSHVVYFTPATSVSPAQLTHAWHDGQAWRTEIIASGVTIASAIAFDIGADGTLFAAWYADANTIELASEAAAGGWTVQQLPASPQGEALAVSGDETGTPHIITCAFVGDYHLAKGSSGWSAEKIPFLSTSTCISIEMSVASGVISFVSNQVDSQSRLNYVRGNSAGWTMSPLPMNGMQGASHSADGRDFIVVGYYESAAIVRGGMITVTPAVGINLVKSAGFSSSGKAWVLEWVPAQQPTLAAPGVETAAFLLEEK